MKYETVVGLEVHTELKTNSKIFCSCTTAFGGDHNTHVCPTCLGLPGTMPVFNQKVLEYAIKVGLALNCEIVLFNKFDRKNYYYPDLPKNWQTSQFDLPICVNGTTSSSDSSNVDYNRTGVPLLEIVSEPDLRSGEEARQYVDKIRAIVQYLGVSDGRMEEGSLRCDANISIRPVGETKLGTKTEIKNMNSLTGIQKGIEYEALRQAEALEDGEAIVQETRTWDDSKGITLSMRKKEKENDYRFFPEPDLVPIVVDPNYVEEIRQSLPELPEAKQQRFMESYGLSSEDARTLTSQRATADYFDAVVEAGADAKTASNWIIGDLAKLVNDAGISYADSKVQPKQLADMISLIEKGTISGKIAKQVIVKMFETGKNPDKIVEEEGLVQITDTGAIEEIVKQVIADNPKSVEDFKSGKGKAIGFLVGQVMRASKGKANPGVVNELLEKHLQAL